MGRQSTRELLARNSAQRNPTPVAPMLSYAALHHEEDNTTKTDCASILYSIAIHNGQRASGRTPTGSYSAVAVNFAAGESPIYME